MPVYANTSDFGARKRHPSALVLIIGGHAAVIAAVMAAKMDLPQKILNRDPIIVQPIPIPPDPPPVPEQEPQAKAEPVESASYTPPVQVPLPTFKDPVIATTPVETRVLDPVIGTGETPAPKVLVPEPPVRLAAVFNTPRSLIEPPYPPDKQRLEEEAVLRLKLTINERGRVVAVEPVGRVDRSFFEAARRHLIANWRYKPATEDGKAVPWSTTISLTFRIE